MTIASASVLTPKKARKAARDMLAAARLGGDPAKARATGRKMPTVRQFSATFMDEHVREKRKPSTQTLYQSHFDRLINPIIGSIKLDCVTKADVSKMHRQIARTGKGGKRREGAANHALVTLSSMYGFAVEEEVLPIGTNPVHRVERYVSTFSERYLTLEELGRIGAALWEGETVGIPWETAKGAISRHGRKRDENRRTFISPFAAAAIRLLIFTGARRNEILTLKWEYVDLERGVLRLPDSKTGHKVIELNTPALSVLAGIPRIGPYVIAGNCDKHLHDLNGPWRAVCRRAGFRARLHDLRHTVASIGVNAGLGLPIIGALLGHASSEATARYAHIAAEPVKRGSEKIGKIIAVALTGGREPKAA